MRYSSKPVLVELGYDGKNLKELLAGQSAIGACLFIADSNQKLRVAAVDRLRVLMCDSMGLDDIHRRSLISTLFPLVPLNDARQQEPTNADFRRFGTAFRNCLLAERYDEISRIVDYAKMLSRRRGLKSYRTGPTAIGAVLNVRFLELLDMRKCLPTKCEVRNYVERMSDFAPFPGEQELYFDFSARRFNKYWQKAGLRFLPSSPGGAGMHLDLTF